MARTRYNLCDRALRLLGKADGDNPVDAGDLALANGLIEPAIAPRPWLLSRITSLGSPSDTTTGNFQDSVFIGVAHLLASVIGRDFGVPLADYQSLAQAGGAMLDAIRYRADTAVGVTIPAVGSRGDLCWDVLKLLGIIRSGDAPTSDAVQSVNLLINPVVKRLASLGIVYQPSIGIPSDLTSGNIPQEQGDALAQILTVDAATEFGPPYISGTLDNYNALSEDGKMQLRRITAARPYYGPLQVSFY